MKSALLLIDIQNDYFTGGKMPLYQPDVASKNAQRILEKFRTNEQPVIHIQHIASRPDASFFLPQTNGAEIHADVAPTNSEKIIIKHFPNSFRETDLLDYLQGQNIEQLVVCGMMTHMCVDATVRAAKDFGFSLTIIGDACTTKQLEINGNTVEAEDVHHSFLAALNYFYATVINADMFMNE